MTDPTTDVLIFGAGIAGIAVAYHLSVKRGIVPAATFPFQLV